MCRSDSVSVLKKPNLCFHLPSVPCPRCEDRTWLAQLFKEGERHVEQTQAQAATSSCPAEPSLDLAGSKLPSRHVSKRNVYTCHRESVLVSFQAIADWDRLRREAKVFPIAYRGNRLCEFYPHSSPNLFPTTLRSIAVLQLHWPLCLSLALLTSTQDFAFVSFESLLVCPPPPSGFHSNVISLRAVCDCNLIHFLSLPLFLGLFFLHWLKKFFLQYLLHCYIFYLFYFLLVDNPPTPN